MSGNIFAGAARAKKLAKLLAAADRIAVEGGMHPQLHAAGILESWKNAKPAHFAALVQRAKINPPGSVTFAQFFDALAERART